MGKTPKRWKKTTIADPAAAARAEARKNLDCLPNYILAAYMASGT